MNIKNYLLTINSALLLTAGVGVQADTVNQFPPYHRSKNYSEVMTAATDTVEIDPATPKIFLAIWGANRGPEHIDFLKNEYHQLSGSTVALD